MHKKKPKKKILPQKERFIETARKVGCDEDEATFEDSLRRIGKVKVEEADRQKLRRG